MPRDDLCQELNRPRWTQFLMEKFSFTDVNLKTQVFLARFENNLFLTIKPISWIGCKQLRTYVLNLNVSEAGALIG